MPVVSGDKPPSKNPNFKFSLLRPVPLAAAATLVLILAFGVRECGHAQATPNSTTTTTEVLPSTTSTSRNTTEALPKLTTTTTSHRSKVEAAKEVCIHNLFETIIGNVAVPDSATETIARTEWQHFVENQQQYYPYPLVPTEQNAPLAFGEFCGNDAYAGGNSTPVITRHG